MGVEWPVMQMQFGRMQAGADQLGGRFEDGGAARWVVRVEAGPNPLPAFDLKTR